ncbi:MAG: hypothetical protein KKB34_02260 [Bacteroidetes bacterium]|nr:hypothetical protein [Bacteroidota bacterium]
MNDIYLYIGYTGSVLVAVSLMMKNILRLRTINLVGAATFSLYGYLVGAYPVFFLNGFITLVDVYYLVGMWREKEHFSLMPVLDPSHRYLNKFLEFYAEDIREYFPDFNKGSIKDPVCFFVLRNLIPAGVLIYEKIKEDTVFMHIDYAIPDYRDFKNARFLYSAEQKHLIEQGVKFLETRSNVQKHTKYLLNMGFMQDTSDKKLFRRNV